MPSSISGLVIQSNKGHCKEYLISLKEKIIEDISILTITAADPGGHTVTFVHG